MIARGVLAFVSMVAFSKVFEAEPIKRERRNVLTNLKTIIDSETFHMLAYINAVDAKILLN
jgi:hypothetical protein